ncbi:MAG: hypothetical protein IPG80_19950 [Anaerolineales bacterium]|jgi:hypothetical protein|uniref:hypothetical protein n=1 Tax=Candidatus Villigracilis vicinus TaxID=3140679 RepID=UPI003135F7C0|nr:hypothetical protein [Anaerolineales bacterium]MBK7449270.1 hypothetical protein [Anaerolineales bacterium]MBK9779059.1 hypothetical protein [Anaerolineales bacterium]
MADFLKFLASYEALIYIVLAIGGLFSFRWLYRSWQEWRVAVFNLEREFSVRRLGRSALISVMILVFFCIEFFMASFVIPGLPADFFLTTPTVDFISTPTGTLSPELMTQFAGQPQSAAQPDAAGCTPGQITLTFPAPGDEIKGVVELTGTVNIPNFGFYKYEVAPNGSDTWATIAAGRAVVIEGSLGRWDTTALTPGDYQLRLVVIDNQGTALSPCVVPVQVVPIQ